MAQTVLTPNTLEADSGHLNDVSSWDLKIHTPQKTNKTCTGSSKEFMAVKPETQTPKHLSALTPRKQTARELKDYKAWPQGQNLLGTSDPRIKDPKQL